jgi:hypothetical protein
MNREQFEIQWKEIENPFKIIYLKNNCAVYGDDYEFNDNEWEISIFAIYRIRFRKIRELIAEIDINEIERIG